MIDSVVAIARADGRVSEKEKEVLFKIADKLELDHRFVSHSLGKIR